MVILDVICMHEIKMNSNKIFYKVSILKNFINNQQKPHCCFHNVWASTHPPNPNPALLFFAPEIRHVTYKWKQVEQHWTHIIPYILKRQFFNCLGAGRRKERYWTNYVTYKTIRDLNKKQKWLIFFWSSYCSASQIKQVKKKMPWQSPSMLTLKWQCYRWVLKQPHLNESTPKK